MTDRQAGGMNRGGRWTMTWGRGNLVTGEAELVCRVGSIANRHREEQVSWQECNNPETQGGKD